MGIGSKTTVDCGTFTAVGKTGPVAARMLLEVDYEKSGLLVLELTEGRKTAVMLLGAAEYSELAKAVATLKLDIRMLPAAQIAAIPEWLGIVSYSANRTCILTGGGKGRGGSVHTSLEVDAAMQAYVRMAFIDGGTEVAALLGGREWLAFLACWRQLKAHISALTAGGNFHGFTALTPGTR